MNATAVKTEPITEAVTTRPALRLVKQTLTFQDLADEALALDDIFAMDLGEFTAEHEQLANALMDQLVLKADGYADFITDMITRSQLLRNEEERLAVKRKTIENQIDWMKRNAVVAMQRMDRPKIEGVRYTLALQNNPPAVDVSVLPGALPVEFVRVIPEKLEVDKQAIKQALLANREVVGCSLVRSQHLRIR